MELTLYQVDAFTDHIFGGNPAAICPLEGWIPDQLMQSIAHENQLSETAFTVPTDGHYALRWFTPEVEVDLCGHATLAAAHVFYTHLGFNEESIHFYTRSGMVSVSVEERKYLMKFPSRPGQPISAPDALVKGLKVKPTEVYKSRDVLAIFDSEQQIRQLSPNFEALTSVDALCIIASAKGDDCDFVSRVFAPSAGINEDPVTGSAHCTLIPYWSERLGKHKLHAYQISKRKGELFCQYSGDSVIIGGNAVTFMQGTISVPSD